VRHIAICNWKNRALLSMPTRICVIYDTWRSLPTAGTMGRRIGSIPTRSKDVALEKSTRRRLQPWESWDSLGRYVIYMGAQALPSVTAIVWAVWLRH
jgi:hypothetical protein